jgi:serine/threonine-protein kinase
MVIGNYQLGQELGRGPLGTVYAATHIITQQQVVLRGFTKPADADQATWQKCIERYTEELSLAAQLDHPNIAKIYEFGHEDGLYWVASEFFAAENLARYLDRNGAMPQEKVWTVVKQVGDALTHALGKGLLHLDLTPFNILLLEDETVKVINFGLGHIRDKWGSPYASPEVVRNEAPDARADVFSLGAVIYEMLAGDPPWVRHDADATMAAVLGEEPPELRQPRAVQQVVTRMLQKDPASRYADVGEAVAAFGEAVHAPSLTVVEVKESVKRRTPLHAYHLKPGLCQFDLSASDVHSAIAELRAKLLTQHR